MTVGKIVAVGIVDVAVDLVGESDGRYVVASAG